MTTIAPNAIYFRHIHWNEQRDLEQKTEQTVYNKHIVVKTKYIQNI